MRRCLFGPVARLVQAPFLSPDTGAGPHVDVLPEIEITLSKPVQYLLLALGSLLTPPLLASDARELSWSELAPARVEYENPFEALSGEQIDVSSGFFAARDPEAGTLFWPH